MVCEAILWVVRGAGRVYTAEPFQQDARMGQVGGWIEGKNGTSGKSEQWGSRPYGYLRPYRAQLA